MNCIGTMLFEQQTARNENVRSVSPAAAETITVYHSLQETIEPERTDPVEWIIQYRLPFDVLTAYAPVTRSLPGTVWKGNFYKCGDNTTNPHWLTWSEIKKGAESIIGFKYGNDMQPGGRGVFSGTSHP